MNNFRLNLKRISIWILLLTQILFVLSYFFLQIGTTTKPSLEAKILFLKTNEIERDVIPTYHRLNKNIILKTINTKHSFIDFNSSLCFKNGTDLVSMRISKKINWKCKCLSGWHGSDCGQPEVLWRALLTHRKPIQIKGPRIFERRLVYIFKVDEFSENIAHIRINELGSVVDLFILYEERESRYLQNKLDNKFCKEYQDKILYVQDNRENLWKTVKRYLKNLRNDDIILSTESNEIPNRDALIFLKFYDQWPQPIKFRYRWSVFGFFWLHPSKTIITGGACTVAYLKESFNNELNLLTDNKILSSSLYRGITLGDLNHFGGWFCEYCNDAAQIVKFLANKPSNVINWDEINKQKIDNDFVEDLIENGVYIDGKTQLTKAYKYRDSYFAPRFVSDHNWRYDFLLINFYSKLDYYEG